MEPLSLLLLVVMSARPPKRGRQEESRTLFVSCKHISTVHQLLNKFLKEHERAIGIEQFYDERGHLKGDAPFECVYDNSSRRPFFLLEIIGADAVAERILALNGVEFNGKRVAIENARADASVEVVREKMALKSNTRSAAEVTAVVNDVTAANPPPPSEKTVTEDDVTFFVPRTVLRRR